MGSTGELEQIINLQTPTEPANRILFLQSSKGLGCLVKQHSLNFRLCALSFSSLSVILLHVACIFFFNTFCKISVTTFLLRQAHSAVRSQPAAYTHLKDTRSRYPQEKKKRKAYYRIYFCYFKSSARKNIATAQPHFIICL